MTESSAPVKASASPDGSLLVVIKGGVIEFLDACRFPAKRMREPLVVQGPPLNFGLIGPDGLPISDQTVSMGRSPGFHTAPLFSPDGTLLKESQLYADSINSVRFSPDGQHIAVGLANGTALIYDIQTGLALTEPLRHEAAINTAEFSPDGLRVVTACQDGTIRVWDVATGQPLSEPINHHAEVKSARFTPDGRRVIATLADNTAWAWEVLQAPQPVPEWLPGLAEAVAGLRINDQRNWEDVLNVTLLKFREQVTESSATDPYTRWAKWFFADRSTRTISPFSSIACMEYVQSRIEENTLESLQEAVRLAPTNGLAFARLAKQILAQRDKDNPRRLGEADFFSHYALKWSPNDAEVKKIRAEINKQIPALRKP